MIAQLRDSTEGIRGLGKVDKIYLDNTNLIYSLASNNSKGLKQIQGIDNAFIVKDDIGLGYLNTVPLWQLGLTY